MQYPPSILVEQRLDTYRREHRKAQLHMSVYPWSVKNRSKLMSRVADLMERYETFLCLLTFPVNI
jgi:hypothetical protein